VISTISFKITSDFPHKTQLSDANPTSCIGECMFEWLKNIATRWMWLTSFAHKRTGSVKVVVFLSLAASFDREKPVL
jgi:hypothetical protein